MAGARLGIAGLVSVARDTVVALRVAGAAPRHDGVDAGTRVGVGARIAAVRGADHAVVTRWRGAGDGDAVAGREVTVLGAIAVLAVVASLGCPGAGTVLAGVVERFRFLRVGLASILIFFGARLLLGNLIDVPTAISLGVIAVALTLSIAVSIKWPGARTDPASTPGFRT